MAEPKLTRRQKWIIEKMKKHGAIIQEHRDAFLEVSRWELEWSEPDPAALSGRREHGATVTEKMRRKLIALKLIESIENNPVNTKGGKFVTSESVYGFRFNKMLDSAFSECGGKYEHVDLQEDKEAGTVDDSYQCGKCETWCMVTWNRETQEEVKRSYEL